MSKAKINLDVEPILMRIINRYLFSARKAVINYYNSNREFYEKVTLKDEKEKDISKEIPTEISVDMGETNLLISVRAGTELEAMILHAQHTGTGLDVNKRILEYFGVEPNTAERLDVGRKYFNPNGADVVFRNDMVTILGGKKLMP